MRVRRTLNIVFALLVAAGAAHFMFPGHLKAWWKGWPLNIDAAAAAVLVELTAEQRQALKGTPRDRLIEYHFGLGMAIRNDLGLWNGNEPLLASACEGKNCHPDDASMLIIERAWEQLQVAAK